MPSAVSVGQKRVLLSVTTVRDNGDNGGWLDVSRQGTDEGLPGQGQGTDEGLKHKQWLVSKVSGLCSLLSQDH